MADAVHAAIELKPDLQDARELQRGLIQARSVKRLTRCESPIFSLGGEDDALHAEARKVPTFIFSEKIKSDPMETAKEVLSFYESEAVPPGEQADFIVVNGRGVLSNYKHRLRTMATAGTGMFWEEWGNLTIAAFLFELTWVTPPEMHISEPVLSRYPKGISPNAMVKVTPVVRDGASTCR